MQSDSEQSEVPAILSKAKGKSKSTLLDGNHVFPPFYACYLLKSKATPKSNRTYVGSTPDPPRRIRQHNGEITQGAWKTKRFRPWEMQLIVYGFPSKLTALQEFEWAWQKPELSRHLRTGVHSAEGNPRQDGVPLFPKNSTRNRPETKIAVMRTLLSVPPFQRYPLHVRFFTPEAQDIFNALDESAAPKPRAKKKSAMPLPPPLSESFTTTLDLGGVSGQSGNRCENTSGVTVLHGPIDVKDREFRALAWDKWGEWKVENLERRLPVSCAVCKEQVDTSDDKHLSFAHCPLPNDCHCITHLACLARHFLGNEQTTQGQLPPLLPRDGTCPGCRYPLLWGQVIRACYARRNNTQLGETCTSSQASSASLSALSSEDGSDDALSLSEEDEEEDVDETPKARRTARGKALDTPASVSPKRARAGGSKLGAGAVKKGVVKRPRTATVRGRGRGRSRVSTHRTARDSSASGSESSESEGSRLDREMMEL